MGRPKKPPKRNVPVVRPSDAPIGTIDQLREVLPGAQPVAQRVERLTSEKFSGPLPHPEIFRRYGDVVVDAPERILKVFEEDSRHFREISMVALDSERSENQRSQWMAWSLIMAGIGMTGWLASIGQPWVAGIVASSALAGTIVGFLRGGRVPAPENKNGDSGDKSP